LELHPLGKARFGTARVHLLRVSPFCRYFSCSFSNTSLFLLYHTDRVADDSNLGNGARG